jgi:hypothetical protein
MIKIKNIKRKFWIRVAKVYVFLAMLYKNHKKTAVISGAVVLVAAGTLAGILGWKNYKYNHDPKNQPQVYEALVNVVDQKSGNPTEDARSSLKKGDVIAYFPAGHPWSDTEKISYLIVKIKLTPADAAKLTQPKTQKSKEVALPKGSPTSEKSPGQQTETILARQYRLKLPSFDIQKFWENHQQPFGDKIFDSGLIQKK